MERGHAVILALDTSTSRSSVALVDGDRVLAEKFSDGAMAHGEVIGSLVESALACAFTTADKVAAVAVGTGPGPFTGLRVGIAFARTFGWARSIPVWGVCSLDALAAEVDHKDFIVATDARRKEVYWARYVDGLRQGEPEVSKPADVPTGYTVGEGGFLYLDHFVDHHEPRFPSAVHIALLARRDSALGKALPLDARYLRHPDVSLPGAKP